jgi:hypothetical protein
MKPNSQLNTILNVEIGGKANKKTESNPSNLRPRS